MSQLDPSIMAAIWKASLRLRDLAHGQVSCPTWTAPYTEADPFGTRLADSCVRTDCLGTLHEIYLEVYPRVMRAEAAAYAEGQPFCRGAYATTVAQRIVSDRRRELRAQTGAAKPQSRTGRFGKVAEALPSEWHDQLLTVMLGFASKPEKLLRAAWPFEAFRSAKESFTGECIVDQVTALAEVRADVELVLRTAESVCGSEWTYLYLTGALLARGPNLALDDPATLDASVQDDPATKQIVFSLANRYATLRRRLTPENAAKAAVIDILGASDDAGRPLAVLSSQAKLRRLAEELEGQDMGRRG